MLAAKAKSLAGYQKISAWISSKVADTTAL